MDTSSPFDLAAYRERVGLRHDDGPTLATLDAVHVAHLGRIPFENVDVRLRRPVALDLGSLQAKLVRGGRGGYCFEQNTLFAAALRALGFEVTTLEARVRPPGATAPLPRTHMILRVEVVERAWLADVGFGGDGTLLPVPLDGRCREQPDGDYRVERDDQGTFVLRRRGQDGWRDLYAFTPAPALPVDYEVAHHYTSTHPRSPFVNTLTVQRSEPGLRQILRGRTYTVRRGTDETIREVADDELGALLREAFGLRLSDADVDRLVGLQQAT